MSITASLVQALDRARRGELDGARRQIAGLGPVLPATERDRLLALLAVHDLWLAPVATLGPAVELQLDTRIVQLKRLLERRYVEELDERSPMEAADRVHDGAEDEAPDAVLRRLAAADLVPPLYRWLADEATRAEIDTYLALEGGPDGGFDDLVALCQVGLSGRAKLELGRNYWDEMGRGELADVHTNLHADMARALALAVPERDQLPTEALARSALGSLLATNRMLQPEMVGALGFIELQAGPRSREVAKGLRRVDAPAAALPFYDEHASADPRHGKAWLDEVVVPLAEEHPDWGPRIVRGARWRAAVNGRFFEWAARTFAGANAPAGELAGVAA
jgi:hypothetical protein